MKWLRIRRSPLSSSSLASEAGSVAVEFIILFPLFLLIVVGIVEFGHLWYVDHVITNASREGARAAVVYPPSTVSNRQAWAESEAQTIINDYLNPPNGSGPSVIPGVTVTISYPSPGSTTGNPFTVQITATNVALVLGQVIPAFQTMSLQATTTMIME
ncbi:MAG: TadE/TadG family type IV pilus assembly protein [Desulfobaccales bacterium]